jgi:outer membrane lipoprotein-sorting protein
MKKLIIPFLLSLIFFTQSFSQTVDEILAEHFAVIGQEKLLETETFSTKGKIIQGQFEIPFTSYHKRPFSFKSEASFQGMEIITAYDGETGWSINPFAGNEDPQPMTEEQIDRTALQADYDGALYNYKEKGYEIEFIGTEELDDIEVYLLKLTRSNGDVITYYIDSENYVMLKTKSKMMIQEVETELETIFSNYKYTDEILNVYSIETQRDGETIMQMIFDEVTYNVDIDDSIFDMPEVTAPTDSMKVGTDKEPVTETEEKPE